MSATRTPSPHRGRHRPGRDGPCRCRPPRSPAPGLRRRGRPALMHRREEFHWRPHGPSAAENREGPHRRAKHICRPDWICANNASRRRWRTTFPVELRIAPAVRHDGGTRKRQVRPGRSATSPAGIARPALRTASATEKARPPPASSPARMMEEPLTPLANRAR